ncbi:serine/threonine-protein kinase [Iningainema tapete]|uniref:non-specific serine/threonine protein kinase n=1 Tax=Iningainema tapete BLCC-T55 TaxID=2748662 RepID=A0A8J6XQF0_9CYAN|nr:serine/threonine-protein kinase [Iningainema tapete]MBD2774592.1 serine/threonine protein kinase [Iningainema tapete BLCC-T55]
MNTGVAQIIGGRYQIIKLLGEGGFGRTYLAEDLYQLGSQYAVKHLTFSSHNPDQVIKVRELFKREVETLQKLNGHPQIPKFFAHIEENQEFYLVQEFIDGHSFSDEIKAVTKLEEIEVVHFLKDLLTILEFIHSKNIIHRDINPDNIIRRKDGKLVLIDFGAVKEVITQTQIQKPGTQIYTLGYAPQEQMHGYPRFNSDIYALGMTAIEALTGLEPTVLPTNQDGEVIWQDQAEVSPKLARILSKMVQDNCNLRYQSVTDVLIDIDTIANSSKTQVVVLHQHSSKAANTDKFLCVLLLISIIFTIFYAAGWLPEKTETLPQQEQSFLKISSLTANRKLTINN